MQCCWSSAGAQVRRAIVCDGATVGTDAKVCEGSVVGFQCVVGAGHTVPKHARVTLCSLHDGTSDLEAGISGHVRSRSGLDDDSGDEDQPLYSPAPTILAVRFILTFDVTTHHHVFLLLVNLYHGVVLYCPVYNAEYVGESKHCSLVCHALAAMPVDDVRVRRLLYRQAPHLS